MTARRLKHVAEIRVSNVDKKSVDGDKTVRLCNYTDVYSNDLIVPGLPFMPATATAGQMASFALRAGDVVITKDSETADDIAVPAFVPRDLPGVVCGYHLALIRPRPGIDGRFLFWALKSQPMREQFSASATGVTRFGLRADAIGGVLVPCPPPLQQRMIADYLDRETARIDALFEKKQRMSELLDDALDVRIESSLCRSSARQVPLRRLIRTLPQYGASESGVDGPEDWPRYIRITDLAHDATLRDGQVRRLPPAVARPYLLADWDLLIARSGATVGKAFAYRSSMGPCCFAGYLIRFSFDERKLLPGLVELWTRTRHYWSQIGEAALQATIENVSAEKYKDLVVPVPPRDDQDRLLAALTRHRDTTTLLRARLRDQRRLLIERRAALVTAAVTGELEVAAGMA